MYFYNVPISVNLIHEMGRYGNKFEMYLKINLAHMEEHPEMQSEWILQNVFSGKYLRPSRIWSVHSFWSPYGKLLPRDLCCTGFIDTEYKGGLDRLLRLKFWTIFQCWLLMFILFIHLLYARTMSTLMFFLRSQRQKLIDCFCPWETKDRALSWNIFSLINFWCTLLWTTYSAQHRASPILFSW